MLVFGCEVWGKGAKEQERTGGIAKKREMILDKSNNAEFITEEKIA